MLFRAFCESDATALFSEDVTSSCLCNPPAHVPLSFAILVTSRLADIKEL